MQEPGKNQDQNILRKPASLLAAKRKATSPDDVLSDKARHPTWNNFIRYCQELRHGEIELLKIQDGLPVLAEVIRKKIKFAP